MTTTALVPVDQLQQRIVQASQDGDAIALRDLAAMGKAFKSVVSTRRMGLDHVNHYAEVVVRAERALGLLLLRLRSQGLYGPGVVGGISNRVNYQKLVDHLRDGPKTSADLARLTGLTSRQVQATFRQSPVFMRLGEGHGALWSLDRDVLLRRENIVDTADVGITHEHSSQFQKLARIPDGEFEATLARVRQRGGHISRASFLGARPRSDRVSIVSHARGEPVVDGFEAFRQGAMELLGWRVNGAGESEPSRNGLLMLPDTDLTLLRKLVQGLADAYNETIRARRG